MTGGVNTQMTTKTAYSNYDGNGTNGDGKVDYNEGKKGSIFDSAQLKNENVTPANFNQEYGIKAPGLSDLKNFNTTQLFEGFLQKQFGVFNSGSKEVTGANEAEAEAQRVAASKELDIPVVSAGKTASQLANDDLQNAYQNAVNEEYDAEVNKADAANELPFYVQDDTSKDKIVSYDEVSGKLADAMNQDSQVNVDNQAEGSNDIDITKIYTEAVQDFSQDYFTGKDVSADTAQGTIDNAILAKAAQGNKAVTDAIQATDTKGQDIFKKLGDSAGEAVLNDMKNLFMTNITTSVSSVSTDSSDNTTQSYTLNKSHKIDDLSEITGVDKDTLVEMNSDFSDEQKDGKEKIESGTEVNLPSSVKINHKMKKKL